MNRIEKRPRLKYVLTARVKLKPEEKNQDMSVEHRFPAHVKIKTDEKELKKW